MWGSQTDDLDDGRSLRVKIQRDGHPVPYADTLDFWQSDEVFCAFFTRTLANAPFDAYLWETPPITRADREAGSSNSCSLNSPELARPSPDPGAFAAALRFELMRSPSFRTSVATHS